MKSTWIKSSAALAVVAAVAAVALAAYAHHTQTRQYDLWDRTTQDKSHRGCQVNDLFVVAKCSSHANWTRLASGTSTSLTCPASDDVNFSDGDDFDDVGTFTEKCAASPTELRADQHVDNITMRVNINGTWDCRQAVITLTAQQESTCMYSLSYPGRN